MQMHGRGHHRHRPRGVRSRILVEPGHWAVRARVERFLEPALLLLLAERPLHGYELLDVLPELIDESRVDVGNLYRVLRALEEEDIVSSAKRTYELTAAGRRLLDEWAGALREAQGTVSAFLDRYERRERR